MAFTWTEERIAWYLDAGRYGDYHQRLADKIAPYLRGGDSVCDLGCGLGLLDVRLAPLVAHIDCVDTDRAVLGHLRQKAAQLGIDNLSAVCADAETLGAGYDVALMVFFGHPPQLMFDCMRLASRLLIRVANLHPDGAALQPSGQSRQRETAQDIALALDAAGCSYELRRETFEFGQPLRSVEDARAFVRCNSPDITHRALEVFLDESLLQTGRTDFPLYLPGKKELGIFIIQTGQ